MPLILRLTKRSAWPGDGSADAREQAVAEFHRRPVDTDGVSVFEVETQADRELVVAAIACGRLKDDRPVDLIAVDRSVVERYGPIAVTLGGSPVDRANLLHRSLDWPDAELRRMAEHLADSSTPATRYSPGEVRTLLAALRPDDVTGDEYRAFVEETKAKRRATLDK